jgi:two-component system, LuxR family, response regulator FixJ
MSALFDNLVVLVVDDDAAVLASLKFALEVEGFAVVAATNARDFLETAADERFGCIVIDYDLPEETGLDLLRRIRVDGVTCPAILITTSPSAHVRNRAAAADVPIVEKPLFGTTLSDAIRAAMAANSDRFR